MADTFYKAVLNGSYLGKDNQCTLYYRTAIDTGGGAFGFGGAAELAEEIEQEIVPNWLLCKPVDYQLQTIDIYPVNPLVGLIYQLPYKREVNRPGEWNWVATGGDSPALCVNIRFNLEPVVIGLQAFTAPKRGYIAVGPIASDALDNSGKLADNILNNAASAFQGLCTKLGENLESIDPPCVWFPVRVSGNFGALGVLGVNWGWADVQGASLDEYASFRRSRRIKG